MKIINRLVLINGIVVNKESPFYYSTVYPTCFLRSIGSEKNGLTLNSVGCLRMVDAHFSLDIVFDQPYNTCLGFKI